MPDIAIHERIARDYLAVELREEAPRQITAVGSFDEQPLEHEGAVTVFAFQASIGGSSPEAYYVVAGRTITNYYPEWGLDAEQIYEVHLGTRFMLVVEVQQIATGELPADLERQVCDQLAALAPDEPVTNFQPVAAFAADTQKHAVYRATIAGEDVYVLAGDLPLGIYRDTHLPPHVVYRRHLGTLIRLERE